MKKSEAIKQLNLRIKETNFLLTELDKEMHYHGDGNKSGFTIEVHITKVKILSARVTAYREAMSLLNQIEGG